MKSINNNPITFDRFARWIVVAVIVVSAVLLVNYLSKVLLPFVVAWLLAYLLHPITVFVEKKLHVKPRFLAIVVTLLFVICVISGIIYLIIPPMIEECMALKDIILDYVFSYNSLSGDEGLLAGVQEWFVEHMTEDNFYRYFVNGDLETIFKTVAPSLFTFISETFSMLFSVVASCIAILYMFFILLDYDELSEKMLRLVPQSKRQFARGLQEDVSSALNNYFRGQCLVAFIMAVLFAIGLTIIDFPMAIGLAILIGIMDLVPYLHTLALLPTLMLSLIKASATGQNFWMIFLSALAVFIIVQVIIDLIVTPRVMSKAMNLRPAVLLLSLSVWGMILGFIGLIIALPLTTILISYYKRYVVRDDIDLGIEEKTKKYEEI